MVRRFALCHRLRSAHHYRSQQPRRDLAHSLRGDLDRLWLDAPKVPTHFIPFLQLMLPLCRGTSIYGRLINSSLFNRALAPGKDVLAWPTERRTEQERRSAKGGCKLSGQSRLPTGQQVPEEEVEAAVSDFLFVVPFQTLKWRRHLRRDLISKRRLNHVC